MFALHFLLFVLFLGSLKIKNKKQMQTNFTHSKKSTCRTGFCGLHLIKERRI